ncbi:hypothetical protein C8F01DRAFT_4561 [Mycena amicta]|nr:hypothetical protein C8F01DRAFT_4561 [Mycena amicta]
MVMGTVVSEDQRRSRWAIFPRDVLGEIFLACISPPRMEEYARMSIWPRPPGRISFPLQLTHVCCEWRETALAFPRLWSFLDVEQNCAAENVHGAARAIAYLDMYLQRSRQLPLTIFLAYSGARRHDLLNRLLAYADRWETVYIESYALCKPSLRSIGLGDSKSLTFTHLKALACFDSRFPFIESDSDEDEEAEDEDETWDDSDDEDSESDDDDDDDLVPTPALLPVQVLPLAPVLPPAPVPASPPAYDDVDWSASTLLDVIPLSNLQRYHDYGRRKYSGPELWEPDEAILELSSVVHLRYFFEESSLSSLDSLSLPNVRYASLDLRSGINDPKDIFDNLDLPGLQGLNLRVNSNVKTIFSNYFPFNHLVILRLCGPFFMTNTALTTMFTALGELADLTFEVHSYQFDIAHVLSLLTPRVERTHVPKLQTLRMVLTDKTPPKLLSSMVSRRFGGLEGAEFEPLRTFSVFNTGCSANWLPTKLCKRLQKYQKERDWDLRLVYLDGFSPDLWEEPFDGQFLLDG